MDWITTGLLALGIGLPALLAVALFAAAARLQRLRWRRASLGLAAPGAVAPEVRATLDAARPVLAALGFEFRYTTASEPTLVSDARALVINDVYQHVEGHTHAIVTTNPDGPEAWSVLWISQLRSGHVLATVDCYQHHLVTTPSGWLVDDGYLGDPQASWQRHLQRLPANLLAVVTDGVEFFHANKQAVDGFIDQCDKRGLMAPHGEHWALRRRTALAHALRLFIGRIKAARARWLVPSLPGAGRVRNAPAS